MTESQPRWRRTPRRRPAQILDASLELFADRGYEDTSVRDIAGAADVSVGTVYRYFASKEHVLDALHERFHEGLEEAFGEAVARVGRRVAAGDTLDAWLVTDVLIDAIADYMRSRSVTCRVIASYVPRVQSHEEREAHDRLFIRRLATVLDAGTQAGVISTSDPEMTAHLLYYALRDSLTYALAFDADADLDRLVGQAKEVVSKAVDTRS